MTAASLPEKGSGADKLAALGTAVVNPTEACDAPRELAVAIRELAAAIRGLVAVHRSLRWRSASL